MDVLVKMGRSGHVPIIFYQPEIKETITFLVENDSIEIAFLYLKHYL